MIIKRLLNYKRICIAYFKFYVAKWGISQLESFPYGTLTFDDQEFLIELWEVYDTTKEFLKLNDIEVQ